MVVVAAVVVAAAVEKADLWLKQQEQQKQDFCWAAVLGKGMLETGAVLAVVVHRCYCCCANDEQPFWRLKQLQ